MFLKGQTVGFIATLNNTKDYISISIAVARENKPVLWVNCFIRENLRTVAQGYQVGDLIWIEGEASLFSTNSNTSITISASAIRRIWLKKERAGDLLLRNSQEEPSEQSQKSEEQSYEQPFVESSKGKRKLKQ